MISPVILKKKTWRISRPRPDLNQLDRAVEMIKNSTKPLIICGGGAHYSCALDVLKKFVHNTHIPIAETFAGKGLLDMMIHINWELWSYRYTWQIKSHRKQT